MAIILPLTYINSCAINLLPQACEINERRINFASFFIDIYLKLLIAKLIESNLKTWYLSKEKHFRTCFLKTHIPLTSYV